MYRCVVRLPVPEDASKEEHVEHQQRTLRFASFREVRHTIIRIIGRRLRKDAPVSWQGCDFDFTGVIFDGGDLSDAHVTGGRISFREAQFTNSRMDFTGATFSGGTVDFTDVRDLSVMPQGLREATVKAAPEAKVLLPEEWLSSSPAD